MATESKHGGGEGFEAVPGTAPPVEVIRLLDGLPPSTATTLLKLVHTLLKNAVEHEDEKYRTVRASNKAIRTKIVDVQGGVRLLLWCGFAKEAKPTESGIPETVFQFAGGSTSYAVSKLEWLSSASLAVDTLTRPATTLRLRLLTGRTLEPGFPSGATVGDVVDFVSAVCPTKFPVSITCGYPPQDLAGTDASTALLSLGLRPCAPVVVSKALAEGQEPHAPEGFKGSARAVSSAEARAAAAAARFEAQKTANAARKREAAEAKLRTQRAFEDDRKRVNDAMELKTIIKRDAAKVKAAKSAASVDATLGGVAVGASLFDVPMEEKGE